MANRPNLIWGHVNSGMVLIYDHVIICYVAQGQAQGI